MRSNSSWNQFSRPISSRGRTATGQSSQRTRRSNASREAILEGKTYVVDLDLRTYFDTVRHHLVLAKVARRVNDDAVLWLLRVMLKASGRQGVPQGGVISPLLSNVYLNEVDRMLERAKDVTRSTDGRASSTRDSLMIW